MDINRLEFILGIMRAKDGYPPSELEILKFFILKLDKGHLESMEITLNMNWYDVDRLLNHILSTWDDGARRTVYMYFKGFPSAWIRFAKDYFESLEMPDGEFPATKDNYSSYAVWFARRLAQSIGLHSREQLLCRKLCQTSA
jgi:hypothetical protein